VAVFNDKSLGAISGNQAVRAIEVLIARYGAMSDSPLAELHNSCPGGGIVVAWDLQGRQFKIEITQVGGPQ
jgi:hypothetical protein